MSRALYHLSYLAVGHLGVEPSDTALSGRPLHQAGSWPAEDGGVEPHGPGGPPRAFKARCRAGGASSRAESGGHDPQRLRARSLSKRRPPLAGSLSMAQTIRVPAHSGPDRMVRVGGAPPPAEDGDPDSQRLAGAHAVSSRGRPPAGSSPMAESGGHDPHGLVAARRLATGPGRLAGSLSVVPVRFERTLSRT
jgi:hypothetical protein